MNRLNKILTLILIFSFLLVGTTLATIEKNKSKRKTNKSRQNVTPGDSTIGARPVPDNRVVKKRPHGYDDFVDKNSNGIDDRAEQKKDGLKKEAPPEITDPNSSKIRILDRSRKRQRRSPDDSVVKLKNR